LQLAVLSKEDFDLTLGLLQFFAAGRGKLQPFFKEFQRLLERHIALLKLIDDLFQALKTIFKFGHRAETPFLILLPEAKSVLDFFCFEAFFSFAK
jgi:hypothetical protein